MPIDKLNIKDKIGSPVLKGVPNPYEVRPVDDFNPVKNKVDEIIDVVNSGGSTTVTASTNGKILVNSQEVVVYTHPATHSISEISTLQTVLNSKLGTTYTNVVTEHNAVGDGVTDCKAAFVAAQATGKDIYVPSGTYLITGTGVTGATQILLSDNQSIIGEGRKSILKIGGNYKILAPGSHSIISNLKFQGTGKTAGLATQSGIYCINKIYWEINNCMFIDFSGSTLTSGGGGGGITIGQLNASFSEGGKINNCWFDNNNTGILTIARAEYVTVTGIKATNNTVGVAIGTGNFSVVGGEVTKNTTGIRLLEGVNDAHGIVSGVMCNHNTTNVNIDGADQGHTFNACNFYSGNIIISNSNGVKFIGCDFLTGTMTLTSNTKTLISSCRFPKPPTTNGIVITISSGESLIEANNLDF